MYFYNFMYLAGVIGERGEPWAPKLVVLNQTARPRGKTSLISSGILLFSTIWIRMTLPLCCPPCSSSPPCHANTTFPRTASSVLLSVCLLLGFFPVHVLLHHCVSHRLAFLICYFQPCLLSGSFFLKSAVYDMN